MTTEAEAQANEDSDDMEEEEERIQQEREQQQPVQQGARPTALTARVGELPVEWTQMNADTKKSPADRLRYPHDAAELNTTDTDIMIVGTAGQKITQIGPDFSTNGQVNKDITDLVLRSHLIRNMEGLEGFTKLELLELYDNQIEELKCLDKGENGAPGPTLRVLDMSYNMIREMKPVALCPNLQELYLANNKLKSIQGLKGLSNLRKIDLGANRIRVMDEEELSGLVSLEELWMGKNKIEKITGLEKLTKLRRLDLQSNRLEVVENLTSQINTLEEIYLAHNGITTEGTEHETGLAQHFKVLSVVDLGRNRLTSANSFAHIITLEELWLSGNKIATFDDIQALSALPSLDTIYLEYNPLQDNNPLYRKRIHEIMPCLKQIDANMIAPLPMSMYTTSTGTSTGRAETDEAQLRRMQDMVITRAKEEQSK